MRNILLIIGVFIFLESKAQVQGQLLEPVHNRVMIIPFNDFYYLSDADPELAKVNHKNADEVSTLFRYGITNNIATRVISSYDTYNILTDTTVQSRSDLDRIYSSIQYKYQKPINADTDGESGSEIFQQDIFGIKKEEEKSGSHKKDNPDDNKKFMNAVVKDDGLFSYLQEKYDVNLFVFINQFELKTNWENCLDLATNNFEREIIVHFTIYDAQGKILKGDAASVIFPSAEKSFDQIIGVQFPLIAEQLGIALQESTTESARK